MENYEKKYKNTLEVKDVNLEKEIELIKGDYEQVDVAWNNDFDFIARHFFELGLKAYEKKYKNALEWARQVMNGETGFIRKEVEEVFPELAESEDEKIRKELIEHIKANKWADYVLFQKFSPDDVIAWLEKQESVEEIVARCKDSWYNEGKIAGMAEGLTDDEKYQQGWHDAIEKQGEKADNANKVELKFHEGDWIVDNDDGDFFKVTKVREHTYHITGIGDEFDIQREVLEDNYHKFTIQDAKEGDVLVDKSDGTIGIFQCIGHHPDGGSYNDPSYCFLHCRYDDGDFYADFENGNTMDSDDAIPATKAQCDKLFKAMADAGYEWNAEKKELKKSEPKFKVKYAGREYNVLEIKESAGVTYYGIEDEPNHIDYVLPENCEIISGYGVKEKGNSYPTKSAIFSEQNSAWNNGYSNGYIQAVEKAVEWLENHNDYIDVKDGNVTYFDMKKCVEDFSKYMKGGEE